MKKLITQSLWFRRIVTWGLIAIYTLILPSAILVYRKLESAIGQEATGKIPLIAVVLIGLAYTWVGYSRNKNFIHLLYLIPCALIAFVIIKSEPNPNKHIHIPEYVLMAWLLYAALSKEYQGKGIFILIFICGSFLGVVDELEQGLHPKRFYGWSDMTINSTSTLIGIFTILGLTDKRIGSWAWAKLLKEFKNLIAWMIFGIIGAILMCVYLFSVQALEQFWGVYPTWLMAWNLSFPIAAVFLVIRQIKRFSQLKLASREDINGSLRTAQLWIYPPLAIIIYMHLIVVFTWLSGSSFR